MFWLLSAITVVSGIVGVAQLSRDPRVTKRFWIDCGFAVLNLTLFVICGAMFMLTLWKPMVPRWHFLLHIGFLISWIGYGFLWLFRAGPRLDAANTQRKRPGVWADVLLIGVTAMFGTSALIL